MDNQQFTIISDLIVRYIMSTISPEEMVRLGAWISESDENYELFHKIISSENFYDKIDHYTDKTYMKAYEEFVALKTCPRKRVIPLKKIMKYVAVVAILVLPIYLFVLNKQDAVPSPISQTNNMQVYDVPILRLSNGQVVRVDSLGVVMDQIAKNGQTIHLQGDKIEYPNGTSNSSELLYNELIVPNRCRQKVVLSDKSIVWLNSNSSIRYPMLFASNERRVYISGEALFEVTKDPQRPFVVETDFMSVNVIGTLFNVNAYPNQSNASVTLVNGRVTSKVKNESYDLVPDQQLIWDKKMQTTEIREVSAVDYTLWVDGIYVFNKVKFRDILLLVERCYGITCHLENEEYNDMEITGELDINKGLMSFIELLSRCSDFKFSLTDEAIIII